MTTISDERLAERGVEVLKRIATAKLSLEDASLISGWVHDARNALRAQGGVRVSPALLQGVCDSLRAAIYEYEDRDVFPGARTIMQAHVDAILSSLEASPAPVRELVEASCPGCRGTGDQGGNPSYGVCDDCNGTGKVGQPLPAALAAKGGQ